LYILFICITGPITAGTVLDSSWPDVARGRCSDQTTAWWSSDEAIRIAENVLLYQKNCGGWYKNTDFHLVLSDSEKATLLATKTANAGCTIDNGAVDYELQYLSRVYGAISDETVKAEIKTGFLKGVQYLLDAQYDNGGWPQFFPYRGGYSDHITYNDDAMVHAMEILRHIHEQDGVYTIVAADTTIAQAGEAFDVGLDCMMKTLYNQHGRLTVWCAQHHYETLEPVMARSYELASLSGGESSGILEFLMSIDNPSEEIVRAIYSGATWYDENRITGQRLVSFTNSDGLPDLKIVYDETAPDMWARFYRLEDNRPFFCDRDGIMVFSIAEIGYERRTGYAWYGGWGFEALSAFNTWLNTNSETILICPLHNETYYTTDTIPVRAAARKNTGHAFVKFQVVLDQSTTTEFTDQDIATEISGLSVGEHTVEINAIYADDYTETRTATFSVEIPTYDLVVTYGSGDGNYQIGSVITIHADPPRTGKTFDQWTGDIEYLGSVTDSVTTFTIPGFNATVKATYKDAVGVEESTLEQKIRCYPNPAGEVLFIDLPATESALVEIYDMQNRKVYTAQKEQGLNSISTAGFVPGVYILRISDANGYLFTGKVIVDKR